MTVIRDYEGKIILDETNDQLIIKDGNGKVLYTFGKDAVSDGDFDEFKAFVAGQVKALEEGKLNLEAFNTYKTANDKKVSDVEAGAVKTTTFNSYKSSNDGRVSALETNSATKSELNTYKTANDTRVKNVEDNYTKTTDFNTYKTNTDKKFFVQATTNVTANNTTIDVTAANRIKLAQTAATTIATLTGQDGQRLTVFFTNGNTTIANGASIKLKGGVNYVGAADETLVLENIGGVWQEVARSSNHA